MPLDEDSGQPPVLEGRKGRQGRSCLAAIAQAITIAAFSLAIPLTAATQEPGKVYRIGFLGVGGPAAADRNPHSCPSSVKDLSWSAFRQALRELGYAEGHNLVIECRWTEGREERAPALAAELVGLNMDLLVVYGTVQVRAAKQATSVIPIVMVGVIDPVGRGLVASLSHPGGNVTGLTYTAGVEIAGKRLQFLKDIVPTLSRVAVLLYVSGSPNPGYRKEMEAAAQAVNVTPQIYEVRDPEQLEAVFAAMRKAREEALLVMPNPVFGAYARRLVDLAAKSRLPAVYPGSYHAEAGGLMVYGVNEPDLFRRLGLYVDKILKGTAPSVLPVEQPTKFDLIINRKAARALGLTIPQSVLVHADELVE